MSPDDHTSSDGVPDEADVEVRAVRQVGAASPERAPAAPDSAGSAGSEAQNVTAAAVAETREASDGVVDVQPEVATDAHPEHSARADLKDEKPRVEWGARGDGAPAASPVAGDAASKGTADDATSVADGARVLVVTDRDDVRERFTEESAGASLEVVAEARAALDRMARERYDVLVLDVNLGGKQTGPGVLRVARTLPGYDGTFAVALGATDDARGGLLDAGFDACISDPLTRHALRDVLGRAAPGALPA
jgi:CheY-like chemotaxis protein